VQKLRAEGRFVCFIGDGINDLVAMRAAQVSIAVAGATTAANAVAGIMIYDGDLTHVIDALKIGDLFRQRLSESIMASFVPDAVSVGLILFGGGGFLTAVVIGWFSVGTALATILRPWPEELRSPKRKAVRRQRRSAGKRKPQLLEAPSRPVVHKPALIGRVIEGKLSESAD